MKAFKKILMTAIAVALPLAVSAQAQINTKKVKIADFQDKITKVVLTGNAMFDSYIKGEFNDRWRISPFEFCTMDEFETLKSSAEFYFLMFTKGQFRKEAEPGLRFITLVKGGNGADSGIGDMLEIVSMPLCSAEDPSGREYDFLPVFLDIIQQYTLSSLEKDVDGYIGLGNATLNLPKARGKRIVFAREDLSAQIDEKTQAKLFNRNMSVMDSDDSDALLENTDPDTIISFTVAPTDARNGSYCYKMLINAGTHELCYYRKHRISPKSGAGFLTEDIKRISANTK